MIWDEVFVRVGKGSGMDIVAYCQVDSGVLRLSEPFLSAQGDGKDRVRIERLRSTPEAQGGALKGHL